MKKILALLVFTSLATVAMAREQGTDRFEQLMRTKVQQTEQVEKNYDDYKKENKTRTPSDESSSKSKSRGCH